MHGQIQWGPEAFHGAAKMCEKELKMLFVDETGHFRVEYGTANILFGVPVYAQLSFDLVKIKPTPAFLPRAS